MSTSDWARFLDLLEREVAELEQVADEPAALAEAHATAVFAPPDLGPLPRELEVRALDLAERVARVEAAVRTALLLTRRELVLGLGCRRRPSARPTLVDARL